jgi:hypothetical protein
MIGSQPLSSNESEGIRIGERMIMEKEIPRKSTKKSQEKTPESEVEEVRVPQAEEKASESKGGTFTTKINNLHAAVQPTVSNGLKSDEKPPTESSKFSAIVVPHEQRQKPIEASSTLNTGIKKELTPDQLEIEADLYADIATLNSLMSNFEKGNLDIATYKRQVQSLITDVMKSKVILEKTGITMQEFMKEEKIIEQYPVVSEKFKSLESDTTLESFIESLSITKADVASATAEIVTDLITLSDYAKLGGDMAKVESLIPIMEVLINHLADFPSTRGDYWGLELLRDWLTRLSKLPVDAVLGAIEAKRLETDVNRLLDDFKRRLKEI